MYANWCKVHARPKSKLAIGFCFQKTFSRRLQLRAHDGVTTAFGDLERIRVQTPQKEEALMRCSCSTWGLALLFFLAAIVSQAAHAQTDVAASIYGAFNSTTTTTSALNTRSRGCRGRIIRAPPHPQPFHWLRSDLLLQPCRSGVFLHGTTPAGSTPTGPVTISANAYEITGDWLFSAHVGKLMPFALSGLGLLQTEPTSGQSQTTSSNELVFVYGAGVDWKLVSHFGLRLQYRGNVYKARHVSTAYGSNTLFTHTAEPMIGVYFRF